MTVVATTTQFAFRLAILTLLDGLTEVLALKVARVQTWAGEPLLSLLILRESLHRGALLYKDAENIQEIGTKMQESRVETHCVK